MSQTAFEPIQILQHDLRLGLSDQFEKLPEAWERGQIARFRLSAAIDDGVPLVGRVIGYPRCQFSQLRV